MLQVSVKLRKLDHVNVVRFLGYSVRPTALIFELCEIELQEDVVNNLRQLYIYIYVREWSNDNFWYVYCQTPRSHFASAVNGNRTWIARMLTKNDNHYTTSSAKKGFRGIQLTFQPLQAFFSGELVPITWYVHWKNTGYFRDIYMYENEAMIIFGMYIAGPHGPILPQQWAGIEPGSHGC